MAARPHLVTSSSRSSAPSSVRSTLLSAYISCRPKGARRHNVNTVLQRTQTLAAETRSAFWRFTLNIENRASFSHTNGFPTFFYFRLSVYFSYFNAMSLIFPPVNHFSFRSFFILSSKSSYIYTVSFPFLHTFIYIFRVLFFIITSHSFPFISLSFFFLLLFILFLLSLSLFLTAYHSFFPFPLLLFITLSLSLIHLFSFFHFPILSFTMI
ncbi:unnamed protein product [Acanthosepion pharaonis]|uniref:Uncharacterized protein n=1 Tax=Acanthosepion pharaonis TaxID=158019 RepID=A0A812ATT0_ACAPH|nr:unnamed protein product [Sepia pharaonis]